MEKVKIEEKETKVKSLVVSGVNIADLFKEDIQKYCEENKLQPIMMVFVNTEKEAAGFFTQSPEGIKKKIIDVQFSSKEVMKKMIGLFDKEE